MSTGASNSITSQGAANVQQGGSWQGQMLKMASEASSAVSFFERGRNPMLPNNFLDVSAAGFPSDIMVIAAQIPRSGVPQEMAQYRHLTQELRWLHLPWDFISQDGGLDGKPNPPGVVKIDLGAGQSVAGLPGHYLLFANRKQYEDRRARNTQQASERLAYKFQREEQDDSNGARRTRLEESRGTLSLDDLIEYEKELGDEPSRVGRFSG